MRAVWALRTIAPGLGAFALLVVTGCAGAAPPPAPAARVQAASIPYQVGGAAVSSATARQEAASAADTSCDPTASLRPTGPPRVTAGSFMAKIRAQGYLVAGVDPGTYHFGFYDPSRGQFEGFDIDMLHAIAKAIFGNPNKIEFRSITDAQRIPPAGSAHRSRPRRRPATAERGTCPSGAAPVRDRPRRGAPQPV